MRERTRAVGARVLLGSLLSLCLWGCAEEPIPAEQAGGERAPRQVIDGMELRQTSTRGLLWVLKADTALSYGEDEPTELINMTVRFFDGKDVVQSILTSKRGQVDSQTETLAAEDSVRVVTADGDRLETEYLEWNPKTERVQTPRPFRLFSGEDILTGVGIEADPDLREYAVYSDLRAVVKDQPIEEGSDGVDEEHDGER